MTVREAWRGYPLRRYSCDVLVIGGGLAGLMAAREAARSGARVIVAAKGFAGADGASVFAGGVVLYLLPGDDWEAFFAEHEQHCEGLAHPEVVRAVASANSELWTELAEQGAPVARDADGRPERRWLPIGSRVHVPRLRIESVGLMRFLRQQVLKRGVRCLDQLVITRLVVDPQEGVIGAVGFHRQRGELVVFRAPNVVLAAGGCSWRGAHMGQHNLMGQGYALAAQAGAELASMEFCASYLATCSLFDTHGQCVLAALGGRFRNRHGEEITSRYADSLPAPTHRIALAMLMELREGRGPIVLDLREVPEAVRRDWRRSFPLVAKGLERTGVDVFTNPVPWLPGFTGSIASSGGVRTHSLSGDTSVPGLFVAGDTAMRTPLVGAGSGITFLNLAWAATSGHWAGRAAAGSGRRLDEAPPLSEPHQEEALAATVAPLERRWGQRVEPLLGRLQRLVVDPEKAFFRTADRLERAIRQARALREEAAELRAGDWHDLARCHEVAAAALTAEAMLRCAAVREETRGWHVRLDFPEPRPDWARRWTTVRLLPLRCAGAAGEGARLVVDEIAIDDPASFSARVPGGDCRPRAAHRALPRRNAGD